MITKLAVKKGQLLFRLIIPVFPEVNIFTRVSSRTTALGPVMVATAADKLWSWRVEIIDENNYYGPRDSQGLPDHNVLQKENPADVVGFYCGLTCTIERVWKLAEFYQSQGIFTITGGWHASNCPEETLNHNVNVVVHGDGELVIGRILEALRGRGFLEAVPGISFMRDGKIKTNPPDMNEIGDLNNLPYPDFGLLGFAKIKWYPIGRIRGCKMNCEFCNVKGEPRWACAEHLFNTVKWLVEKRKARYFFIVDDRLEGDIEGTIEFFRMISEKYGNKLRFTVQIRLEAAENVELLRVMKNAGVRIVCIGYESPIDEDLKAMQKGYLSSNMLKWTKIWRRYFWVHGMFIVGYPRKKRESSISAEEAVKGFRKFIRKARLDTIQILLPGPAVGTGLRQRLEQERRIFPLEIVPWSKYDGNYVCFEPDNMSARELQEIPAKLMRIFYDPLSFFRIPIRTIAFPVDYFVRGWRSWHWGWSRDIIKYGGYRLIRNWQKKHKSSGFIERLEEYQKQKIS